MSYCRFVESDAYIYDDIRYGLLCCMCLLSPIREEYSVALNMNVSITDDFIAGYDYDRMINHVAQHREKGHYIPEDVDERLIFERDCDHIFKKKLNSQVCENCGRWADDSATSRTT